MAGLKTEMIIWLLVVVICQIYRVNSDSWFMCGKICDSAVHHASLIHVPGTKPQIVFDMNRTILICCQCEVVIWLV